MYSLIDNELPCTVLYVACVSLRHLDGVYTTLHLLHDQQLACKYIIDPKAEHHLSFIMAN